MSKDHEADIAQFLSPLIGELGMRARALAAACHIAEIKAEWVTHELDDSGYFAVPADAWKAVAAALAHYYAGYNELLVKGYANDNEKKRAP